MVCLHAFNSFRTTGVVSLWTSVTVLRVEIFLNITNKSYIRLLSATAGVIIEDPSNLETHTIIIIIEIINSSIVVPVIGSYG